MKKILFLDADVDDFGSFFRKERNFASNVDSYCLYKKMPIKIKKIFLFLGIYVSSIFLYFIYGQWKKKINEYDMIVIPSRKSVKGILKKKYRNKIVVYYWNLITSEELQPQYLRNINVKCCTFDRGDADKFNIDFVDTYYFNLEVNDFNQANNVFYVGVERDDRVRILDELSVLFERKNILYDFNIIKKNSTKGRLSYEEIISRIAQSSVILDLNRNNQLGLTLRPLESLIFSKKLITNNFEIKNYPFYKKENIFILGCDDLESIDSFINSEYIKIDDEIIEYYYFENWINRLYDRYK